MALERRKGSGLHLFTRLVGLTGLAILAVGFVLSSVLTGFAGVAIIGAGAVLAFIGLVGELRSGLSMLSSRRGALGSNVVAQIILALVLFGGVNAYAFFHYERFDLTRERIFTIPAELREQLRGLRGETTIVVYQRGSGASAGQDSDSHYDAAAERKIVEKVKDLAEQFQELGPRFRVEVLDIKEKGFQKKLESIQRRSPVLALAIEKAPENSIFFYSTPPAPPSQGGERSGVSQGGESIARIQRLGFQDVYQIDKQASTMANNSKGNLVLKSQGLGPFARKVLNIEEKSPRVAVGVIHEYLGMESKEDLYAMQGAKKSFTAHGISGMDVILKMWPGAKPVVLTYGESEFERLEVQMNLVQANLKELKERQEFWTAEKKFWESSTLAQINKKYGLVPVVRGIFRRLEPIEMAEIEAARKAGERVPPVTPINDEFKRDWLDEIKEDLVDYNEGLARFNERREALEKRIAALPVEDLAEKRRIADLRSKFSRMLADSDLLILPRMTIFNAVRGERIPNRLYQLDEGQLEAVRDFIKAGKPVLFLLGPSNESQDEPPQPGTGPDRLETMLTELGFKLPKQTILYDIESEAWAEQKAKLELLGTQGDVPSLVVDWQPGAGSGKMQVKDVPSLRHPIRTSLRLVARSAGKDGLDLRLRYPRPVYYLTQNIPPVELATAAGLFADITGYMRPTAAAYLASRSMERIDESTVFLMTNAECWNESNPFPEGDRIPKFERPKADDPNKGTVSEKRRGPFPVGVAVETQVPASWYSEAAPGKPAKVRIAVIGHGGIFIAPVLSPMREKVLLDTCNWLVGRDDLLNKDDATWEFPRVELSATGHALWNWGTRLGLPLVFVYLGVSMFLVRRMR